MPSHTLPSHPYPFQFLTLSNPTPKFLLFSTVIDTTITRVGPTFLEYAQYIWLFGCSRFLLRLQVDANKAKTQFLR